MSRRRLGRRLGPMFLTAVTVLVLYYVLFAKDSRHNTVPPSWSSSSPPPPDPPLYDYTDDPSKPPRFVPSSFDWAARKERNPVRNLTPLPEGVPRPLPPVQNPDISVGDAAHQKKTAERRDAVRELFLKGWTAYRDRALGADELGPVSGKPKTTFGGWAATAVDALDTLWIMGLDEEFRVASRVACAIDFGQSPATSANVFETTIRHLGGLLAAYDLSEGDKDVSSQLLSKAVELGNMLYSAFDTPNRMPVFWLRFHDVRSPSGWQLAGTREPIAAGASLCLEFTRLAQITGDARFHDAVERVRGVLYELQTKNQTLVPGMWPVYIDWRNSETFDRQFSLGAGADSLYEYLPKMFALHGGLDERYAAMTATALDTVRDMLLFRPMIPNDDDILFSGDATVRVRDEKAYAIKLDPVVQHLGCFAGGMYALAGRLLLRDDYVDVGAKLTRGCAWAYRVMPVGVMPEISTVVACGETVREWVREEEEMVVEGLGILPTETADEKVIPRDDKIMPRGALDNENDKIMAHPHAKRAAIPPPTAFSSDLLAPCPWDERRWTPPKGRTLPRGVDRVRDPRYLLRPEAIESVFYMWRVTGDEVWRDTAWDMFEAIRAATGAKFGSASVESVLVEGGKLLDSMESFWFAETLKYFYLVFSPADTLSLDEWVFNTEAHPFRRPGRK